MYKCSKFVFCARNVKSQHWFSVITPKSQLWMGDTENLRSCLTDSSWIYVILLIKLMQYKIGKNASENPDRITRPLAVTGKCFCPMQNKGKSLGFFTTSYRYPHQFLSSCLFSCMFLISNTRGVIKDKTMRTNKTLTELNEQTVPGLTKKSFHRSSRLLISVADLGQQGQSQWASLTLLQDPYITILYSKVNWCTNKSKVKYPSLNTW